MDTKLRYTFLEANKVKENKDTPINQRQFLARLSNFYLRCRYFSQYTRFQLRVFVVYFFDFIQTFKSICILYTFLAFTHS